MDTYEKKYKEALSTARRLYNMRGDWTNLEIESIFPELRESEDERIRKSLIDMLKNDEKCYLKEIAWLEKQGKKDMGISEATKQELEDNLHKALEKETPESWNKFLEGGQKRSENNYPKYHKGDILTDGKSTYKVLSWDYTEAGTAAYYMESDGCKFSWGCESADKKLKPLEQKPTEEEMKELLRTEYEKGRADAIAEMQKPWSKEDEETLKDIITSMTNLKDSATSDALRDIYNSKIDWLKSIKDRIQPQPKSNWSEEDRKIIIELIGIFESAVDGGQVTFPYRLLKDYIRVLKSCLPQNKWKPSDEQMQVLLSEVTGWTKGCPKQIVLESLYNDLQKLKG